jgi:iron complex outermembrane receptor protein
MAVAVGLYGAQARAATPTSSDTATVGELVVVAEKREEKIETVPVAITAYSATQRKLMGIEIVQDLANFTPSLVWTDINDRIFIRGIGRNSDNLNNTSGVAIYYNGLYYGANASVELQKDDLFVGNIEVDAGPQNTLHGSNSDGGVVNFISQRPTDTYYAEGRFGVANFDEEFVEGVVSGPINDHLNSGSAATSRSSGAAISTTSMVRRRAATWCSAAAATPSTSKASWRATGITSTYGRCFRPATSTPTPRARRRSAPSRATSF